MHLRSHAPSRVQKSSGILIDPSHPFDILGDLKQAIIHICMYQLLSKYYRDDKLMQTVIAWRDILWTPKNHHLHEKSIPTCEVFRKEVVSYVGLTARRLFSQLIKSSAWIQAFRLRLSSTKTIVWSSKPISNLAENVGDRANASHARWSHGHCPGW